MVEPLTIGLFATEVFSAAAKALIEGISSDATRIAYAKLKNKIAQWTKIDIENLEANPASVEQQKVVADQIDNVSISELAEIKALASELLTQLNELPRSYPIGLELGILHAKNINLGEIIAKDGIALRASEVRAEENFTLGKLVVDGSAGKTQR